MTEDSPTRPVANPDDPAQWLGPTALMDLQDPKLRLRVRALTQLSTTERQKALALYACVKRIPFGKRFKLRLRTAREVLESTRADAADKATLLVAMLRAARLPARVRYVALRGEILRGLTSRMRQAGRPLVEVWLDGQWQRTDTYIFDASYMAAARHRLKAQGWDWGWGIGVNGQMLWDGFGDAYVSGLPPEQDPMLLRELGVFDDPGGYLASPVYRERHPRLARALHLNVLAPLMQRAIRRLRLDLGGPATHRS